MADPDRTLLDHADIGPVVAPASHSHEKAEIGAHADSHAADGPDPIAPESIGAAVASEVISPAEAQAIRDDVDVAVQSAQTAATQSTASAADAADAVTLAQQAQAASLEVPDDNTAAMIGNPATLTHAALLADTSPVVAKDALVVNAADYGVVADGVTDDTAALDAAATAAAGGVLYLPPGVILVTGTWPLSGRSCSIYGVGAGHDGTNADRSVIRATAQTGPVMDFTGFAWPRGYRGALQFSDFAVEGDGTATVTNTGIKVLGVQGGNNGGAGIAVWRNIVVSNTGGAPWDMSRAYLHNWENCRVIEPVNTATNDVPYFIGRNLSGCDINLDIYSPSASGNVGVSGAVILTDDGTNHSTLNRVNLRVENMHPGTGATILHSAANDNVYDVRFFDCTKESGASDVSFIRLAPTPTSSNLGGNQVIGTIPGDNGAAAALDYGVDVQQSNNRVVGAKGFRGKNVRVRAGVTHTYVSLEGARGGATDPGIIDDAQHATNTLRDWLTHPGTGESLTARKTVKTDITSSATAVADPHLQVRVGATGVYRIEAVLLYWSTATADLQVGIESPSGSTSTVGLDGAAPDAASPSSTTLTRVMVVDSATGVLGGAGTGPAGQMMARLSGTVNVSTVGGYVSVKWAQAVSEATATSMRPGSVLTLTRIA